MCGIVSVFNNNKFNQNIEPILKTISHRGVEQEITNGLGYSMGIVRLPIVDKENSRQPLEYKEHIIVFNGELYNYKELREKYLKNKNLKTQGDAEVFLALWVEYGDSILKEFRGMFGAVIYNKADKSFVAIRDYLGMKPLYFTIIDKSYYFASEYKAFNAIQNFDGKVKHVLPGHYYDGKKQVKYNYLNFEIKPHKEDEVTKIIYELMDIAVKRRINSGQIGALLSGGIDSSIIAYHIYKYKDFPLYTVGTKDCEDIDYAKIMAEYVNCKKHRIHLLQEAEVIKVIDEIIWHTENYNKYTIINSIPAYFAIKMAKEDGINTLLCGEGSDELFAGYDFLYNYYTYEQLEEHLKNALNQIHRTECLRMDRMAMLYTIEGRAPFLDMDLVEYAISINKNLKYNNHIEKYILRRTYDKYLPCEIVCRKKNNFYKSTGVEKIIENWASSQITDKEFQVKKDEYSKWCIRSKEELLFFLKWKEMYPKLFEQGRDYFNNKTSSILNIGIDLDKEI